MSTETSKAEIQREEGMKKSEQNIQELWNNYRRCNTCNENMRKRREKETEQILETTMTENFQKLMTDTKSQFQETQRIPSRINTKTIYTQAYHIKTVESQRPGEKS